MPDRDRERGAELRGVVGTMRDLQFVEPRAREGDADQAPALLAHEVDRGRRHLLRRHDEVALVLAVLVVDDDDLLAEPDVGDRGLDRIQRPALAGKPDPQLGERGGQGADRLVGRLPAARAQIGDRALAQTAAGRELGGGQPGRIHGRS